MRMSCSSVGVLSLVLIALLRSTGQAQTTYTVTNTADSGQGSLRQAILDANANPGKDVIAFSIPGGGIQTISLLSPLPDITDSLVLDGRTQPGSTPTHPKIELSGAGAGAGANGIHVLADSSEIWSLSIYGFQALGSDGGNGIVIEGGFHNTVDQCVIGSDANQSLPVGNQGAGVLILNASATSLGGTGFTDLIVANETGIRVVGGTAGHAIQGCTIGGIGGFGNRADGVSIEAGDQSLLWFNTFLANGGSGVVLGSGSSRTQLRYNNLGVRNAGNGKNGVEIDGSHQNAIEFNTIDGNAGNGIVVIGGSSNTLNGNTIGRDASNGLNGIQISASTDNSVLGCAIGNSGAHGILIDGSTANDFEGNMIGFQGPGDPMTANAGDGVRLTGVTTGNRFNGNTISGNLGNGVRIVDAASTGNEFVFNRIGVSSNLLVASGNGGHGILIDAGAGNRIGGTDLDSGNFIGFNSGAGIFIASGARNALLENVYRSNGGLGIDLAPAGVTPNDPGDGDTGANDLQNFPVLSSAASAGTMTNVLGFLSSASSTSYRIEFFSSVDCDASSHGQGEQFLGFKNVSTDATGMALIDATLVASASGSWITATATDPAGNTSELSACVMLMAPVVTSISPTSGPAFGGTFVRIRGMRFLSGATVAMGGADASDPVTDDDTTIFAVSPPLAAGALYDVSVTNPGGVPVTLANGWLADFTDVPAGAPIHDFVEKLIRHGVTAGCTPGNFCPDDAVSRAQVAVFLLRAHDGNAYTPPPATGTVFTDVPVGSFAAAWIEQLAARSIAAGCGGGAYCPESPVTREQMAVLILRTEHGAAYVPPDPTGVFSDVPVSSPFARWVERLAAEGITTGCGGGLFCPQAATTRGEMAVFLVTAFGLN